MKTVIILFSLAVVAIAAPPRTQKDVQILRYENDSAGLGNYNFGFDTSDGVSRQESAELKNFGNEQEAIAVRGQYSWVGEDGQQYVVNYIADENGFQPQGSHLPH